MLGLSHGLSRPPKGVEGKLGGVQEVRILYTKEFGNSVF